MELEKLHTNIHYQNVLLSQPLGLYVAFSSDDLQIHMDDTKHTLFEDIPDLQNFPSVYCAVYKKIGFLDPNLVFLSNPDLRVFDLAMPMIHKLDYSEGVTFTNIKASPFQKTATDKTILTREDMKLKQQQGLMFLVENGQVATQLELSERLDHVFGKFDDHQVTHHQEFTIKHTNSIKAYKQ